MILINAALGVFAFLCGMTLVASIAVNIQTQNMLKQFLRKVNEE